MRPIRPTTCYERLPFPIAFPVHLCELRGAHATAEMRVLRLISAAESLIRYLTLVAVSDYLDCGAFDPDCNRILGDKLRDKLAMGTWQELLRRTVQAFFDHDKPTRPGELRDHFYFRRGTKLKPTTLLNRLNGLVEFRNHLHHGRMKQALDSLEKCSDDFTAVLTELAFLAEYPLVVPVVAEDGDARIITQVVQCMGHPREFPSLQCEVDVPASLAPGPILNRSPVLLDRGGTRVLLNLYPLTLFEEGPNDLSNEVYRYERSLWDGDAPQRVTFAPQQPGFAELDAHGYGDRAWVLRDFQGRLARAGIGGRAAPGPNVARDTTFPSLETEIDERYSKFVGRDDDCARLLAQMDRQGRGYVCYQAPFGMGKSSFAAFLIRQYGWPGHLIKREGRRDQPARFLRYLLGQLLRDGEAVGALPDDVDDLREELAAALAKASGPADRRVVIVLDGLHELPPEVEHGFLLDDLPPRVFFVLLSQPCELLDELERRVKAPWENLSLEGLSDKDALEYLDQTDLGLTDEEMEEVVKEARGLPYYLERAVWHLSAGRPWRDAGLNLEAEYRGAIDRAFGACTEKESARVLGLLCACQEALSFQDLLELVKLPARRVRAVLAEIRPYLQVRQREVGIFHETFRGALRRELSEEELRHWDEEIVRWIGYRTTG